MKTTIAALALLVFCGPIFCGLVFGANPPALVHTDGPAQGIVTLDLQELWRAGGEDGEVIFGRITDVIRHPNGEVYVLDNQLCQVEVFDPEGNHLRTLTRQGDGPGEVRQPIGLVLLPGDHLGIGAGFPGKMVTMQLDGTPVATRYPIGEPSDGNIGVMISLDTGGGVLAATGGHLVFNSPTTSYTIRFLAVSEGDGQEFTPILERQTPIDPTGRLWDEAADYYFDGRWDLGPDGLIYVPMERDGYLVSVFDRTGELQLAFGRDLKPRKRTDEDKQEAGPIINVTGQRNDEEWDICDTDPAISRVMLNPNDGTIWVLTPHGSNDQPDGILETWDVFGPAGEFLRQAAVPLGNEIRDGACYLAGDEHLIVIRGTGSSFNDDGDGDLAEEEEVEPLEVICYRIR
jgi:hypothetical protein